AGGAGALAGTAPHAEALGAGAGVQDVRDGVRPPPVPARADGAAAAVPAVGVEPTPADLLPPGGPAALLREDPSKSASGCADPCWPRTRSRRKEKDPWPSLQRDAKELLCGSRTETVRLHGDGRKPTSGPRNLACLRTRAADPSSP